MMETTEELTGTLVLVHPGLPADPAGRQNCIGSIIAADLQRDDVFVSFGTTQPGLYGRDALLLLRTAPEIYAAAIRNPETLATGDFKAMLRISMLTESGSRQEIRQALEMVQRNQQLIPVCMLTLQDKLGQLSEIAFRAKPGSVRRPAR